MALVNYSLSGNFDHITLSRWYKDALGPDNPNYTIVVKNLVADTEGGFSTVTEISRSDRFKMSSSV